MKMKLTLYVMYPLSVILINCFLLFSIAKLGGFRTEQIPCSSILNMLFVFISERDSKIINLAIIVYSLVGSMVFSFFIFRCSSYLLHKLIKLIIACVFILLICLCSVGMFKYYNVLKGALEFYRTVYLLPIN